MSDSTKKYERLIDVILVFVGCSYLAWQCGIGTGVAVFCIAAGLNDVGKYQ